MQNKMTGDVTGTSAPCAADSQADRSPKPVLTEAPNLCCQHLTTEAPNLCCQKPQTCAASTSRRKPQTCAASTSALAVASALWSVSDGNIIVVCTRLVWCVSPVFELGLNHPMHAPPCMQCPPPVFELGLDLIHRGISHLIHVGADPLACHSIGALPCSS